MIDQETARDIAIRHLREVCTTRLTVEIVDSLTIEKAYGWVFFFNSKEFLDSRDRRFSFLGNWPVVVARSTGQVVDLDPSSNPVKEIERFENAGAFPKE